MSEEDKKTDSVQLESESSEDEQDRKVATEDLAAQLDDAKQEIKALEESVLRAKADAQNIQKRADRDVVAAHKYALENFSSELLGVVDSLEHGIQAADIKDPVQKNLAEGMELTLSMLFEVFKKFGIQAIDPQGEVFDPTLHEAMTIQEDPDVAPNTVIEVFQKGYTLNNRLVRPARVVVSKATERETPKI